MRNVASIYRWGGGGKPLRPDRKLHLWFIQWVSLALLLLTGTLVSAVGLNVISTGTAPTAALGAPGVSVSGATFTTPTTTAVTDCTMAYAPATPAGNTCLASTAAGAVTLKANTKFENYNSCIVKLVR